MDKVLVLTLMISVSSAWAQPYAGAQSQAKFHRTDLDKIFANSKPNSIPEFVKALPSAFAGNRIEFYKSQSLHCSTFSAPRVVMFSSDGHLVCSYNSGVKNDYLIDQDRECVDTLNKVECITWDPIAAVDRFFEIDFSPDNATIKKVPSVHEHNEIFTKKCSTCHFESGRRIFNPYFTWTGAFGSVDDSHTFSRHGEQNSVEKAGFIAFKKSTNPRYTNLPPYNLTEGPNVRPNLMATELFTELHFKKQAKRFHNNPRLAPFRYAVIGAMMCGAAKSDSGRYSDQIKTFFSEAQGKALDYRALVRRQLLEYKAFNQGLVDLHVDQIGNVESEERITREVAHLLSALNQITGVTQDKGRVVLNGAPSMDDNDDWYFGSATMRVYSNLRYVLEQANDDLKEWSMIFSPILFFDSGGGSQEDGPKIVHSFVSEFREDTSLRAAFLKLSAGKLSTADLTSGLDSTNEYGNTKFNSFLDEKFEKGLLSSTGPKGPDINEFCDTISRLSKAAVGVGN